MIRVEKDSNSSELIDTNSIKVDNKRNSTMSTKTPSTPSQSTPKPASKGKRKISKAKKSSCRKQYKKLKPRLKRLIEEGVMLRETLRRKQDKLIEMSRDIHYILGRLLPYQKKLMPAPVKPNEIITSNPIQQLNDQTAEVKCEASEVLNWDGFVSCSPGNLGDGTKNHLNLCLSAEVERQLASMISDKTPLTLPDNIFSET